jgi:TolB-like protein
MLISDLNGLPRIKIIERESLEKILKEQALSLSGLTEGKSAEIGKILQADKLIYGSYILTTDNIRIDLKLVKIETAVIEYTANVNGKVEDIFLLQTELVSNIRNFLNITTVQIPHQVETKSITALASYYIGLDHMDNKRYEQAESEFKKATELDPLFARAQNGLAESYKFLKAFKKHRQQHEIAALYSKINNLMDRIAAPQWYSFADIVQSPQYRKLSPEQQQAWNSSHNEYLICNTPVQCTWHIMLTLDEIARKSLEYFDDVAVQQKVWKQIDQIGEDSRLTYKNDPFLNEILYIQLLAYYSMPDYPMLKAKAEEFLIKYPDYRLIEAVEGWYEYALEKLDADKK